MLAPDSRFVTAKAALDVDLSRRVESSGDAAARVYAALVVRSGRGRASSRGSANSGANHRGLGAMTEDLAGDRTDCGAPNDLLHVLALGLILHLAHLRVARSRANGIGMAAERHGHDAEAHHDVVVRVLTPFELGDFDIGRRASGNDGAIRAGDCSRDGRVEPIPNLVG